MLTSLLSGIAIAGGGAGSQAAAEDVLAGDLAFIQEKALKRYNAVVGSEGERYVRSYHLNYLNFLKLLNSFLAHSLVCCYSVMSPLRCSRGRQQHFDSLVMITHIFRRERALTRIFFFFFNPFFLHPFFLFLLADWCPDLTILPFFFGRPPRTRSLCAG